MQRQHNCSPAASFASCVMTLYLLKVHPQTFLSISLTQKCQFGVVALLSQMREMSQTFFFFTTEYKIIILNGILYLFAHQVCVHTATRPPPPIDNSRAQEEQPRPRIPHRSFTAIIQYTVHTSRVRLDDEISTSAAH